jgi:protein gp37
MAEGARQSACGDSTGGGCYAERDGGRFCGSGMPYDGLVRVTAKGPRWTGRVAWIADHVADPLRWAKPRRIFVNSVSDFFHEELGNNQIAVMVAVMALADHHIYQVLTKRTARARAWFDWVSTDAIINAFVDELAANPNLRHGVRQRYANNDQIEAALRKRLASVNWPLPNVHLGASVEHQFAAVERIGDLLACPAAVHWLSCEPILGPLDLTPWFVDGWPNRLGWVVAGCESGPRSRTTEVEWYRSLRDQLAAAGVKLFLKQARESHAIIDFGEGSKRKQGDLIEMPYLDGRQWIEQP